MQGCIKVNVDGAFKLGTCETVVGVVARDCEGNPHVMAWHILFRCRDAEEAEAQACLQGIQLAEHFVPDVQVVIETNCATIVEKVNNPSIDRSVVSSLIHDIKASRRQTCLVKKTDESKIKPLTNSPNSL